MPRPTILNSRGSPGSSPILDLDVRPARDACVAWVAFVLAMTVGLSLASNPAPGWRLGAAAVVLVLAWGATRSVLFGRGPRAIRRARAFSSGEWLLTQQDGKVIPARLNRATATLGPWMLLGWSVTHPDGRAGGCCHALIAVREAGPRAFRAAKGRLLAFAPAFLRIRRAMANDRFITFPPCLKAESGRLVLSPLNFMRGAGSIQRLWAARLSDRAGRGRA